MTPYEKLKPLLVVKHYLKSEISKDNLDKYALQISDNETAERLQKARQKARQKLFSLIFKQNKNA